MNTQKDELTSEMHAEFNVSQETEYKTAVWVAMKDEADKDEVLKSLESWNVPASCFDKYKNTYPDIHPLKDE